MTERGCQTCLFLYKTKSFIKYGEPYGIKDNSEVDVLVCQALIPITEDTLNGDCGVYFQNLKTRVQDRLERFKK